jgi:hypothetical protein
MPKSDDFETWIRFTVPWQLGLSPSKQVAMQRKFHQFGAYARALQKKAPAEYDRFFSALQEKMQEVSKWKTPKGMQLSPVVYEGKLQTFPNGKLMYEVREKLQKK